MHRPDAPPPSTATQRGTTPPATVIHRSRQGASTDMSSTSRMPRRRPRSLMFAAAGLLVLSALSACGGGGNASPSASLVAGASCKSSSATKLTFWAWVPGMNRAVDAFNKTHPQICVTQENPGAGLPTYQALNNTLKAGAGAPDVAEVEFAELPSFEVQNH